jgi:hypothetical protein
MAIKGTLARILVDEVDLSCETSSVVMANAISEEDCTTLCSTAAEYAAVLPSMSLEQNGYMSNIDEPGSFEQELYNRMGVQGSIVAALFGIDEVDCPVYILNNTFGATMEISAPATGILTLNGSWGQGRGGRRGYRIADANITATGNQLPVDFVPGGDEGGEAFLFLQDVTGTLGTATITIAHSTNSGGTYTTLGTWTVTELGAYRLAWLGNTERWLRVGVTNMGGTTGLDLVVVACVNGRTQ